IRYGMGIALNATEGRRTISHAGGINGFLSESEYFPDDDLIIVVLLNTAGPVNPRDLARDIADAVLRKAADSSRPFAGELTSLAGTYTGRGRGRPATVRIVIEGNQLRMVSGAGSGSGDALTYYGNDT